MKNHGYKKFYAEIYEDRKKEDETGEYVECERTGKKIYKAQIAVHNFSHIKSKGAYPELKFDKSNVEIVSMDIHGDHHTSGTFTNYLPIP